MKRWNAVLVALALTATPAFATDVLFLASTLAPPSVNPGGKATLTVTVTLFGDWHINANRPADPTLIPTVLEWEPVAGIAFSAPSYPEPKSHKFGFSEEPLLVYEGKFAISTEAVVDAGIAPGSHVINGQLRYQACNDEVCLPPRKAKISVSLEIVGARSGALPAESSDRATPATTGAASPIGSSSEGLLSSGTFERWFAAGGSRTFLAYGIIFLIGLGLNLTPCVYPLIPITLGFFANQSQRRGGKTFGLAVVYVLGMAAMYAGLGVFAALSGRVFGSALSSPYVLVFEALVMLTLASSMFGAFEIGVPSFISQRLAASPSGYPGAAFMGLTVGIVAAPCLAPAVLGLFVFVANANSVLLGVSIFFTLAIGLGLPYLFLGTASGAIMQLPRAGEWMIWIKHLFGFLLLAMALYFIRPLSGDSLFNWGIPIIGLAAAIFLSLIDRTGGGMAGFRRVKQIAGVVLGVLAVASFIGLRPGVPAHGGIAWQDYDPAGFESALASGKPVLVDFTAEWCLPCKELERLTFPDAGVVEAAKTFAAFKADGTLDGNVPVEALRDRYGVKGYPTILFIDERGVERADLRLVGFVPPEELVRRLVATVN